MLALVVGVDETHYCWYSLAMRCSFLLFVGGSFLFLARFLPRGTVGFFASASLSGWLIIKIFVLPQSDVAPRLFCSCDCAIFSPSFLFHKMSYPYRAYAANDVAFGHTVDLFVVGLYQLIEPMLMVLLLLALSLVFLLGEFRVEFQWLLPLLPLIVGMGGRF